jgi:hypothetical protein
MAGVIIGYVVAKGKPQLDAHVKRHCVAVVVLFQPLQQKVLLKVVLCCIIKSCFSLRAGDYAIGKEKGEELIAVQYEALDIG